MTDADNTRTDNTRTRDTRTGDTRTGDGRTLADLLSDLPRQLSTLLRKELDLFRAEMSEKLEQVQASLILIGIAAVFALVGAIALALAAVAALAAAGLDVVWAALIVAVILIVFALALASSGRAGLKAGTLVPKRTVAAVQKDAQTLKEEV